MYKKIISMLLVFAMLFAFIPLNAFAEEAITVFKGDGGYQEVGGAGFFADSGLPGGDGNPSRYAYGTDSKMVFTPSIKTKGNYKVSIFVIKHATNDKNQLVEVNYNGGSIHLLVDCTEKSGYVELGTFPFDVGEKGNVTMIRRGNESSSPYMRSGGVKWETSASPVGKNPELSEEAKLPQDNTGTQTPHENLPTVAIPTPEPRTTPLPEKHSVPAVLGSKAVEFSDVDESFSWAMDSIGALTAQGIINGKSEGVFAPNEDITRAEFLKLAVSLITTDLKMYASGMEDVSASAWYAPYVQSGMDLGIIDAALIEGGRFLPDQPITREEMTSIIVKTYEKLYSKQASLANFVFADGPNIADWAKDYVSKAVALDIIKGVGDNRFAPKEKANRAQAAVIIYRLMNHNNKAVFVAPNGDDNNTGTLESPVATAAKAAEIIKNVSGDVFVYFREGIYNFSQPLTLTNENSGKDGSVVYMPYNGESVTFTGGISISNWQQHDGNIYRASVPDGVDFRQLYINGTRAIRARYPNEGEMLRFPKEIDSEGFTVNIDANILSKLTDYKDELELNAYIVWMHKVLRVSNIIQKGDEQKFIINPIEWTALTKGAQGTKAYASNRYWLENQYAFLDSANEWYYDKANKTVYFYKDDSIDLSNAQVVVPVAESIFDLKGTIDKPIENIAINGLNISYTGWNRPSKYGFVDVQANTLIPSPENEKKDSQFRHDQKKDRVSGAINANYANNIAILDCVISHTGGSGILFDMGGDNIIIDGNVIYDTSGSGMELGNDADKAKDARMNTKNLFIENNYVYKIGQEFKGSIGISVLYARNVQVINNYVYKVPYSGICVSWGWGLTEDAPITGDFLIANNRVEDFCMVLSDGGAIYSPNPVHGENLIAENYIKSSYLGIQDRKILGVYHDGCSAHWTDRDNVIENTLNWLGGINHGTQNKFNNKVSRFYYNVDRGPTLNAENNQITDMVNFEGTSYPQEALEIIKKAGLRDNSLIDKVENEIENSIENKIRTLLLGGEEEAILTIKNRFAYDVDLSLESAISNQFIKDFRQTLSLKPGESKEIKLNILVPQNTEFGVFGEKINIYYNGLNFPAYTGVTVQEDLTGVEFLDYNSENIIKVGNFDHSSVNGYMGNSTLYGYGLNKKSGEVSLTWKLSFKGKYEVSIFKVAHPTSTKNAKVELMHSGKKENTSFDSTQGKSEWVALGTFDFDGSGNEYLKYYFDYVEDVLEFLRVAAIRFEKVD